MASNKTTSGVSDVLASSATPLPTPVSDDNNMTTPPSSASPEITHIVAEDFLNDKNLAYASNLTLFVVYIVILMLIGLVGNSLVFVVYYKKYRARNSRTFVLTMSLCDLMTNAWALLSEIIDIRFPYTFYAVWFCKLSKTFMSVLVLFSGLVLVAVAFDRQKLVCGQYTRNQWADKKVLVALLACCIIAMVLSLPRAVLYGSHTVTFPATNVTGVQCNINDEYLRSFFPLVYNLLNALVFVVIFILMGVCYGRVAVHLWRHNKTAHARQRKVSNSSTSGFFLRHRAGSSVKSNSESSKVEIDPALNQQGKGSLSVSYQAPVFPSRQLSQNSATNAADAQEEQAPEASPGGEASHKTPADIMSITSAETVVMTPPQSPTPASQGKRIPSSTTLMLFVLTALFVVNFLPYLIMEALLAMAPGSPMWQVDRSVLMMLFRSYYLNSAINPFVYGICSARFRYECGRLFRSLRNRWK